MQSENYELLEDKVGENADDPGHGRNTIHGRKNR